MSRADLGRELGVTRATVGNSIKVLMEENLVVEVGGQEEAARAGRPGVLVTLNAAGAYFVGLDISTEAVNGVVLDFAMNVVARKSVPIRGVYSDVAAVTEILSSVVAQLMKEPDVREPDVKGICISVPGVVKEGCVVNAPSLGWRNTPLREAVEHRVGRRLPVRVCNDTVALASGYGAVSTEEHLQDVVFILLADGVGSAYMRRGVILESTNGFAGEIGHMIMGPDFGCQTFENLTGYRRFAPFFKPGEPIAAGLSRIADAGQSDAGLVQAMQEWGEALAVGLLNVIHMLDPREIVLGGPSAVLYPLVEDRVKGMLAEHIMHGLALPPICVTMSGDDGGAVGAAALLREELFSLPIFDAS